MVCTSFAAIIPSSDVSTMTNKFIHRALNKESVTRRMQDECNAVGRVETKPAGVVKDESAVDMEISSDQSSEHHSNPASPPPASPSPEGEQFDEAEEEEEEITEETPVVDCEIVDDIVENAVIP